MKDNDIKKALEICARPLPHCYCGECPAGENGGCAMKTENIIAYINRLEAENERFKDRQKPTAASGYKIENGKVVFFTNMLGGCKIVKENLEEVVKTLNELLHEAYSKDEIAFALKCKTEELETAKADIKKLTSGKCIYLSDDETTEYCVEGPCPNYKTEAQIKTEAYKEFADRLKKHSYFDPKDQRKVVAEVIIEHYLKEMGEDK